LAAATSERLALKDAFAKVALDVFGYRARLTPAELRKVIAAALGTMALRRGDRNVDDLRLNLSGTEFRIGPTFEQRLCGIWLLATARLAFHRRHLLAALAEYLLLERVELLLLQSLLLANVIELLLESKRVLFPFALMIAGGNHPDV
jgi:hypothetical protein